MNKVAGNKTIILIAHQPSTIQLADQVIVMHKGSVQEEGSFHLLCANPGSFLRRRVFAKH